MGDFRMRICGFFSDPGLRFRQRVALVGGAGERPIAGTRIRSGGFQQMVERKPSSVRASGGKLSKSILNFCLLEFFLSIPFWAIVALAHAHVIPDLQMLNASWSLTPMMAALILVSRENKAAGVKELFKRCFDYRRIKSKAWYLPIFLLYPFMVFVQYALALLAGLPVPPPHFTLLVPLAFVGFFFAVFGEELGWTGYALDPMQKKWSALKASILLGFMWASFHAPVWILTGQSFYWVAWQWVYVVASRVLFVWIYNNTGKSLFAMALLHPGFGVYWYLFPVSTNLGIPSFYDPRNLAFTAIVLLAIVVFLWGPKTLTQYRYAHRVEPARVEDDHDRQEGRDSGGRAATGARANSQE